MCRSALLLIVAFAACCSSAIYCEPARLPDAKNGRDPKVIGLPLSKEEPHKSVGSIQVYNKKDAFHSVPEARKHLNAVERKKLNDVTSHQWRVSGQLSATEGGGSLSVNEKGEVTVSPHGGSNWEYEFPNGEKTSDIARIKCTDVGLTKRYLKVSDKTEDYQYGDQAGETIKVRRLYLVAEDGDWFRIVGGSR